VEVNVVRSDGDRWICRERAGELYGRGVVGREIDMIFDM
jgi:hypothetical protein